MDDIDAFILNGDSGGSNGSDGQFDFTDSDAAALQGNGSLPVVSDITKQSPAGSLNMLGSGGSTTSNILNEINQLPQQAKAAGTLVGQLQNIGKQSAANFNAAQSAQASNNSLATWWLYASTTDKLLVGLTALTIVVMVMQKEG